MTSCFRQVFRTVAVVSLLAAPMAACDADNDGDAFRQAALDADVSLEDAVDEAEATTPTSVAVDAVFVLEDGDAFYEVMLQDGDVERVVRVEAMRAGRASGDVTRSAGRGDAPEGRGDAPASRGDAPEGRGDASEGRGDTRDGTRRGAVLDRRRLAEAIRDTCRPEGDVMVGARLLDDEVEVDLLDEAGEREATSREALDGRVDRSACTRRGSRGDRGFDRGGRGGRGDADRSGTDRGDDGDAGGR